MRWIFTPILLTCFVANAQQGINFGDIARESSESLDVFGYYDPVFKWDMEGRVQGKTSRKQKSWEIKRRRKC